MRHTPWADGIDVAMLRADLWDVHRLGAHISHRTSCSASCGTAYCRRPASVCERWTEMYEAGNHTGLVMDAAWHLAQDQRATAAVASDYSPLRLNVREGHVSAAPYSSVL